ncbi:MAG: hypothetical protein ACJ71W_04655 [Terriglobales bacterium]
MPERKTTQHKGKLPTNIEEATRAYVRENLAAWDEDILIERAKRLGVSKSDAAHVDPTPLYMIEAQKRAEEEDRSVESVLRQYSEDLQISVYPTPECLLPHEIRDYFEHGTLHGKRLSHAGNCNACEALLAASLPGKLSDIWSFPDWVDPKMHLPLAARNIAGKLNLADPLSSKKPQGYPSSRRPLRVAAGGLKKAFTVALPALCIFGVAYFAVWKNSQGSNWPTASSSAELLWIPAFAGLFAHFICLLGLKSVPRYRSLAIGVIVGGVLAGYLYLDAQQNKEIAESAFQWNRAENIAMASIQNQHLTGEFLGSNQVITFGGSQRKEDRVMMHVPTVSTEEARYVLTGSDLSGQMVADVHSDSGYLTWGDGDKVLKTVNFLTGTVEAAETTAQIDPPTQEKDFIANGHRYKCAPCALVTNSGTPIVAAIDPATSRVENYLVISRLDPKQR